MQINDIVYIEEIGYCDVISFNDETVTVKDVTNREVFIINKDKVKVLVQE